MVHYEGLLELHAFYWLEASPGVRSYRDQPCSVYYPDGEESKRYTPDIEVELLIGERLLVEVKPLKKTQEPEIRHKLQCVHQHLTRLDQDYAVWTDRDIRQQPQLDNLQLIYARASHVRQLDQAAVERCLRTIQAVFPLQLHEARQLLDSHGFNVFALILDGFLHCSLIDPIDKYTTIHIAPDPCETGLSQRLAISFASFNSWSGNHG